MLHSTLNSLRGCCRSTAIAAWGSISIGADGKRLCCSVLGNALGKCQSVVDTGNKLLLGNLEALLPEPGTLQSKESLESDRTEQLHFHFSLSCIGEGNGNPLQCSCLENPRDGEPGGLPSMGSHRVGHD